MLTIPATTDEELKPGDAGAGVWALQRGLNELGASLAADGFFALHTKRAVLAFQRHAGIGADGVVGQVTTAHIEAALELELAFELPDRILEGFAWGEGGMCFGAVNWSVPGGVDCGLLQRRVFESQEHDEKAIARAFDPRRQLRALGKMLVVYSSRYWIDHPVVPTVERAWRLAALRHNYPAGADHLAITPREELSAYWTTPADWVPGVLFDDGHRVSTPLEWCEFYALGSPEHNDPGMVTVLVEHWPPL